jgi:hypothetical protein
MGSILGSDASEWVIQLFLAWLRDREGAVYMLVGFLFPEIGVHPRSNSAPACRTAGFWRPVHPAPGQGPMGLDSQDVPALAPRLMPGLWERG